MQAQRYFPRLFSYREMVSRSVTWGHHFLLLNALLSAVLGLAYVYGSPHTHSLLSLAYLIITDLGHMAFLASVLFLVILFPLAFAGHYHCYRVVSVAVAIAFHTAVLVDIKLYLYVRVHLSCSVMRLVLGDMDFKTGLNYNFLFIAVPLLAAIEVLFARMATRSLYKLYTRRPALMTGAALLICFVASHCIHIWADATGHDEITILRTSYPVHYPMTARTFLRSHGLIGEVQDGGAEAEAMVYPLGRIRFQEHPPTVSTVIIFTQNLSAADVSEESAPGLTALGRLSESFTSYYLPYTQAAHNIFAVSYGIPLRYQPSIIHQNLEPVMVYALNHQEFIQRLLLSRGPEEIMDISGVTGLHSMQIEQFSRDSDTVRAFDGIIDDLDRRRPFALTVSLADLQGHGGDAHRRQLQQTDRHIAAMMDKLRQAGLFDSTLIIVSSLSGHPGQEQSTSLFSREQQRVPLLIKWPYGRNLDRRNPALASAFDLSPTLGAHVALIASDAAQYSMGMDLMHAGDRDFIPIEHQGSLLLLGREYTTVFTKKGRAFVENHNQIMHLRPNLENLIRAMRDLNRFKE